LGETVGKECLTDVFWTSKEVGMAHLLRGKRAAQQVNGVFVTYDIPA